MIIRKKGYCLLTVAMCMATVSFPTHAWRSYGGGSASGRFGGSASWSRSSAGGAWGGWGHSSGTYTGPHGNSASWSHTTYGGYHPPAYYGGYHGYGYHPPAYYGSSGYSGGDVAAAGIAGLAVGAMMGSAAASKPAPAPTTVVVQQPMAPPPPPAPMQIGTTLTYLPGGCVNINISSGQYYQCGTNWFRPYFGSNGAYYQVVPAPY
jgi:hypothetical protein